MTGKAQRQQLIAGWLQSRRVGSQEELVARLGQEGIAATQATVSRDLDELGAARVRRDGAVRYVLPDRPDPDRAGPRLDRLLADWVIQIVPAAAMVVLRTPPGSANLVASALDAARLTGIAGTVAGDDTVFVALEAGIDPAELAAMLARRRAG